MLRKKNLPLIGVERNGEELQIGTLIHPSIKAIKEITDNRDITLTIKLLSSSEVLNSISMLWSELLSDEKIAGLFLVTDKRRFKIHHHEINTRVVSYETKKTVESHVFLDWRVSLGN